jgi:hypothetical protein
MLSTLACSNPVTGVRCEMPVRRAWRGRRPQYSLGPVPHDGTATRTLEPHGGAAMPAYEAKAACPLPSARGADVCSRKTVYCLPQATLLRAEEVGGMHGVEREIMRDRP